MRDQATDPDLAWRKERFRVLYEAVYDDIRSYCWRRIPRDAADDVVADVFAIVWQRLDELPGSDRFRPWVFGVARNLIRTQFRRSRREVDLDRRLVDEMLARSDRSDSGWRMAHDELAALVDGLHGLKEADQEAIRLLVWEGLSHAEIAAVLGCSENAVTVRLHRARRRLEKKLSADTRWSVGTGRTGAGTPNGRTADRGEDLKGVDVDRQVADDGSTEPARKDEQ